MAHPLSLVEMAIRVAISGARKRLAEQIHQAIESDNQRSPDNVEERDLMVAQWRSTPEVLEDRFLDSAYHLFLHFLTDRDIRSKDVEYARHQIMEMRQLIFRLEQPAGD